MTKSIFKANDIFNATIRHTKHHQSISGVFDKEMKEKAAMDMIQEFDNATGPSQTQVINEATQKLIEAKNNELTTKIERLEGLLKMNKAGQAKQAPQQKRKQLLVRARAKLLQKRTQINPTRSPRRLPKMTNMPKNKERKRTKELPIAKAIQKETTANSSGRRRT